ncbi:hypothetical protein GCK72_020363 [Caenorhabditis remanei]|uniref:Uncharacterized protein n=1 Tax=Caenorhabditis remanei TaxID=31234 RepID=A0A6A5GGH3_CAERE|nr:hypothetical protein GCK72_020363 [Caenorhabditis remanei]KAF1753806.1 hypothetical protein GCK72_020363 [Caenorhabditis remanei]
MTQLSLLVLLVILTCASSQPMPGGGGVGGMIYAKVNTTATIALPQVANYRREVRNAKDVDEEHIFRVCNGKNKKTCGYWENVKTKKKVASGATTYNKNKKALIVKNMRVTDFGSYMTGNKKTSTFVMNQTW